MENRKEIQDWRHRRRDAEAPGHNVLPYGKGCGNDLEGWIRTRMVRMVIKFRWASEEDDEDECKALRRLNTL